MKRSSFVNCAVRRELVSGDGDQERNEWRSVIRFSIRQWSAHNLLRSTGKKG